MPIAYYDLNPDRETEMDEWSDDQTRSNRLYSEAPSKNGVLSLKAGGGQCIEITHWNRTLTGFKLHKTVREENSICFATAMEQALSHPTQFSESIIAGKTNIEKNKKPHPPRLGNGGSEPWDAHSETMLSLLDRQVGD
ncbi:uncharacterized protein CIMG_00212 [Coccidioides immitis RS]|uniref:Uncharacterized protein n=4 Tax=Coccidioides immitis TaxID=5501 RepID=J3KGI7_COCIM|nr:uncharacterized protein CIMG_00212 [Coccidioides immitis RS]EAS34858.3 hypothetical protein CIMG_00212 [Coccidioides immitis RS]KMP00048.1 hypothetical protein CIRG_00190 [Coccidioides immitis RMSCC 2394]KMU81858.1 hypothetical protein CISG_02874 [Coccidioides immitis RMSCC 3703]KMU87197.1 hypothetical protein CIHG_05138 [Coccidioides immitis H538.4]